MLLFFTFLVIFHNSNIRACLTFYCKSRIIAFIFMYVHILQPFEFSHAWNHLRGYLIFWSSCFCGTLLQNLSWKLRRIFFWFSSPNFNFKAFTLVKFAAIFFSFQIKFKLFVKKRVKYFDSCCAAETFQLHFRFVISG